MQHDPRYARFSQFAQQFRREGMQPPSLWQKIVASIAAVVVFGFALVFSAVFFAAAVAVGVVAWGYLWWKTRAIRKQMRDHPPTGPGLVIEGEVIREVNAEDGGSADAGGKARR